MTDAAGDPSARSMLCPSPIPLTLPHARLAPMPQAQRMYTAVVTYTVLQGVLLILLLIRLVQHLSFQPRLSVISGTLARALPDLATFVLVLGLMLVMFTAALVAVWGAAVPRLSSFSAAFGWVLAYFVTGLDQGVVDAIADVSSRIRPGGLGGAGQAGGGGGALQARVSNMQPAFWTCYINGMA